MTLFGFSPTPAVAAEISPITVEFSTSTAPLIIAAYAHRAGLDEHTELLQRIAYCESKFLPDAKGYNKKDGVVWSVDRGPFQVNDYFHRRIDDPFENVAYAMELYKKNGTRDWLSSKPCWQEKSPA